MATTVDTIIDGVNKAVDMAVADTYVNALARLKDYTPVIILAVLSGNRVVVLKLNTEEAVCVDIADLRKCCSDAEVLMQALRSGAPERGTAAPVNRTLLVDTPTEVPTSGMREELEQLLELGLITLKNSIPGVTIKTNPIVMPASSRVPVPPAPPTPLPPVPWPPVHMTERGEYAIHDTDWA